MALFPMNIGSGGGTAEITTLTNLGSISVASGSSGTYTLPTSGTVTMIDTSIKWNSTYRYIWNYGNSTPLYSANGPYVTMTQSGDTLTFVNNGSSTATITINTMQLALS